MNNYVVAVEEMDTGEVRSVLIQGEYELSEFIRTLNYEVYELIEVSNLGTIITSQEFRSETKPEDLNFG